MPAVAATAPALGTSARCPACLHRLGHHPAPDRLAERGWTWAHCTRCGLSLDRDHAAARRIVARGLLAQSHTVTERATGTRTIRTTVEGTVRPVRRPKKTTRRLRRARQASTAPPRPRGPKTTPGKGHPTPGRPANTPRWRPPRAAGQQAPGPVSAVAVKTSRRMPEVRTVPATTPAGVVQRPAGHDVQTPVLPAPMSGHGVPAPPRREEVLPNGVGRLSRGTCRRHTHAAERTGFHHLHATEVHTLTPRFGPHPGGRRPRRARKA
ncbi:zinc ribbon domain-containing protein [Streptomyces sp. NPDC001530]|uniref:zinc ribbon domain-containing protein n=1 Tax=Streptomyces sp. NPDC001530 TaxID=3364582 RepID=UPI0036C7B227